MTNRQRPLTWEQRAARRTRQMRRVERGEIPDPAAGAGLTAINAVAETRKGIVPLPETLAESGLRIFNRKAWFNRRIRRAVEAGLVKLPPAPEPEKPAEEATPETEVAS